MRVVISKQSLKFLESQNEKDRKRIIDKIGELKKSLENNLLIPFKSFDIKKLEGDWLGYFRLRLGKYRIIFRIVKDELELYIYNIHFRGEIYK